MHITGEGYDRTDLTEEERAKHRELHSVISRGEWPITKSQRTTLEQLDIMKRAWPLYVVVSATIVVLKQYGIF